MGNGSPLLRAQHGACIALACLCVGVIGARTAVAAATSCSVQERHVRALPMKLVDSRVLRPRSFAFTPDLERSD